MKMKKQYGAIFATLFLCIAMHAQDFQPMEYNGLFYQELACNVADKEDAALVVYLHGRHASGSDNRRQLSQAGVQDIAKYLGKNHLSAYFLVPQCPEDREWDGRDGKPGYTESVEDLITLYMKTRYIDVSRIYICGVSMGACGVWKLLKDNPKLFTAAFIVSGQPQRAYPSDFTETPLYVTVGSEERSHEALKWFSSEINKAGGTVRFDVLPGQRHRDACDNAFTAKRLKWLFSLKK